MSGSFDRFEFYMGLLDQRNQALMLVAAMVLIGMLWYGLLARWPRARRWAAWGVVALYVVVMLAFMVIPPPPAPMIGG